jgi:hypothetical protein
MEMLTDQRLLEQIEQFLKEHDVAPSRFGRDVMGDGALVQHLRAGRSLSLKNAEKVVRFMEAYQPQQAAA